MGWVLDFFDKTRTRPGSASSFFFFFFFFFKKNPYLTLFLIGQSKTRSIRVGLDQVLAGRAKIVIPNSDILPAGLGPAGAGDLDEQ